MGIPWGSCGEDSTLSLLDSIPCWGTKILQVVRLAGKKQEREREKGF